jgi:hypothetical protein
MDRLKRPIARNDAGQSSLSRRRLLRALALGIAVGPALAVFVLVAVWPTLRIARHEAGPSPGAESVAGRARAEANTGSGDESPRRIRRDEAYWRSRLALAKSGTINLAVDLIDSTVTLDIHGVPVRECRIKEIRVSRALAFSRGRDDILDRLSSSLAIQREVATLPKEPIRVEIAPKDTTEALEAATRPLAPEKVDVYFTLFLDGNLALSVRQAEKPLTRMAIWRRAWLDVRENAHEAQSAVRSLIRSEFPQHAPRIEVTLPREDAKAIYRALGPHARIAIRL